MVSFFLLHWRCNLRCCIRDLISFAVSGGDVISFLGDAVFVMWPTVCRAKHARATRHDMPRRTRHAARTCGSTRTRHVHTHGYAHHMTVHWPAGGRCWQRRRRRGSCTASRGTKQYHAHAPPRRAAPRRATLRRQKRASARTVLSAHVNCGERTLADVL